MKVLGGMAAGNHIAVESLPARLVGSDKGKAPSSMLLRYAMSLPIHTAEVGIGDYRQLAEDLTIAYNFKPLSDAERTQLAATLRDSDSLLAYTRPGYPRA